MNKETNYWKTAEQMNGRLAMMGFFAAVINYGLTGWIIPGIVQSQLLNLIKKGLFSVITEEAFFNALEDDEQLELKIFRLENNGSKLYYLANLQNGHKKGQT